MPSTRRLSSEFGKKALFYAAEHGVVEIFIEVLKRNNGAFKLYNDEGRTLIQQVIQHRQGKIFSLVYAIGEVKDNALTLMDKNNEDSLEIAGMLASETILAQISSPALQMQSELKWFKEVANAGYPEEKFWENISRKDGRLVFTESHEELKGKAEEWYKGISTSSTVVGALVITVMFTAAFTVPGGNNSNTGLPLFLKEWALKVYIITDAISLFASSTSVLTFLGILTARYEEDHFLKSLPTKLIFALSSLFISIAAMMICFCATVVIMLHGDLKLIIPICLLAISPVVAFISLQFPLLKDVFNSTYRYMIFDRKMKLE